MGYAALLGFLTLQAAEVPDTAAIDPLSVLSGDWQIVDTATNEAIQDCTKAQSFAVAADRKTVVLTDKQDDDWAAHYVVLHNEKNRVLMFIVDEERKTEAGDPVLWWANFQGPDRFRWRRYDWPAAAVTGAEWRRCPPAR